jgi:hypothetical protein
LYPPPALRVNARLQKSPARLADRDVLPAVKDPAQGAEAPCPAQPFEKDCLGKSILCSKNDVKKGRRLITVSPS